MTLYVKGMITDGQCGIGRLGGFVLHKEEDDDTPPPVYTRSWDEYYTKYPGLFDLEEKPLTQARHRGGTGLFGTGFIDTEVCKEVYEHLCATYNLVFVTPVRKNLNSGKLFFYAMFDDKKNDDIQYITHKWPFNGLA